jgi:hypothetical protein
MVIAAACDSCPESGATKDNRLLAPGGNCDIGSEHCSGPGISSSPQPWLSGATFTVQNRHGGISVISGGRQGDWTAASVPFFLCDGTEVESELVKPRFASLTPPSTTKDAKGNVIHESDVGGLAGYLMHVWLPVEFDGVLRLSSRRGPVHYQGVVEGQGHLLHSDDGDVTVVVTRTSGLTVTARSAGGTVNFYGALVSSSRSENNTRGSAVYGSGAGSLDVSTNNGNIGVIAN